MPGTFKAERERETERERCSQQPARQVWTCFAQHCWFRKGRSFEAEGLVMTSKMSLWFIQICGSSDLLGFEIAMQAHGQQSNPSTPEDWDSSTATFEVEYDWWCTIGAGLFWSCPDGAGCFSFVRQRVYASWQLLGAKKALECSILWEIWRLKKQVALPRPCFTKRIDEKERAVRCLEN